MSGPSRIPIVGQPVRRKGTGIEEPLRARSERILDEGMAINLELVKHRLDRGPSGSTRWRYNELGLVGVSDGQQHELNPGNTRGLFLYGKGMIPKQLTEAPNEQAGAFQKGTAHVTSNLEFHFNTSVG